MRIIQATRAMDGREMAAHDGLSLTDRCSGQVVVVEVVGEIDLVSAPHLEQHLAQLLREPSCSSIVLDLAGLEFIDSTGVLVLVTANEEARRKAGAITLVRVPRVARRVLEVCDLLSTFDIRDDNGPAVTAVPPSQ